ncbi:MAG: hypothetical protein M1820_006382 [Bogoriella megaspora]|nr:MAG: hypothetical protein M1820_006382 [Bogoriella megaspora]
MSRIPESMLNIEQRVFEKFSGEQVTEDMLEEASKLFSENYGIWSVGAPRMMGGFARTGERVLLSKETLRKHYLTPGTSSYVKVTVNGQLAGHAFACRWTVGMIFRRKTICWITQLVVHKDYRRRGLATGLLNQIKQGSDDDVFGIMSSHPAACLAAAKAFGSSINTISLKFIKDNVELILKASPVMYVRNARLQGSLFDSQDTGSVVSSADTRFFVDHDEPLEALAEVQESAGWPLGELLDGHEFILILQAKRSSSVEV